MRDREQAVLGRALEVSGSTGGLVPRGTHGLQRIRGDYANYACLDHSKRFRDHACSGKSESNEREKYLRLLKDFVAEKLKFPSYTKFEEDSEIMKICSIYSYLDD